MTNKLQQYFPMIRTREEVLNEIESKNKLKNLFYEWTEENQNEFLDFCTGVKGIKIMYDFMIKEILNRQLNGEDPGKLAYFFHRELACQITAACVKIRELSGCNKAALSGGVFQNRLLLELTDHMLLEQGFEVLKHQLLPPNDGGIALGQAVYAMAYLEKSIETKTI